MLKIRAALLFALAFSTVPARAQTVSQTINPTECALFTAATASADHASDAVGATTLSKPIYVAKMNRLSASLAWSSLTGTVNATYKVQVATVPFPASGDWVDKADASATLSGASGTQILSVTNLTETWARVLYSHVGVTGGSITGYCQAKSI